MEKFLIPFLEKSEKGRKSRNHRALQDQKRTREFSSSSRSSEHTPLSQTNQPPTKRQTTHSPSTKDIMRKFDSFIEQYDKDKSSFVTNQRLKDFADRLLNASKQSSSTSRSSRHVSQSPRRQHSKSRSPRPGIGNPQPAGHIRTQSKNLTMN